MEGMNEEVTLEPTLDIAKMDALGQKLGQTFVQYEKDRSTVEQQWMKNYRQYKGIYDPEVESRIAPDQSKAYPKITRVKAVSMVARLLDMLFPQTEKNWGLKTSPIPEIPLPDLQKILDTLEKQATEQGGEITGEIIEKAILELATKRMKRMDETITDQLTEIDYVQLVRKVVRSGTLYGTGVLKGPFNTSRKARRWVKNAITGKFEALETKKLQPHLEFVPIFDYYPDLTAKTWDTMDGEFQRHVTDHSSMLGWASRPDFMGQRVRKYLRENPNGNWKEKSWETEMRTDTSDRQNIRITGKYEVFEWWGRLKGSDLQACGVKVAETDLEKEIEANIWFVDNIVIKAAVNPFKGKIRLFHQFTFEEDEASLIGDGLPPVVRDSQMACCASARMLLDNGSVVTGPMLEVNHDLLMDGQSLNPYARKIYHREGTGSEASQPAIREIKVDSHMVELQGIFNMFKGLADEETVQPPQSLGMLPQAGKGKEAYRTAQGTSMLLGAAALPIRDIVRNFDKFTSSVIGALVEWNMMFNDDPEIKGDFQPIARGSTSLIAKEIRAQALDQLAYTLSPEDRKLIKPRELLRERLIVRDLGTELLKTEEEVAAEAQQEAQMMAAMQQLQESLQQAQLRETDSKTARNLAQAMNTKVRAETDVARTKDQSRRTQMDFFTNMMELETEDDDEDITTQ